jgi:DNA repair ATPase RecN
MKKKTDYEDEEVDILAELRKAITESVKNRLSLSKTLIALKGDNKNGLYDEAITELEEAIDAMYETETQLGNVHQYVVVGAATESI